MCSSIRTAHIDRAGRGRSSGDSEAEGSDSVAEGVRKSAADRTLAAGICGKTAKRKTALRL